MAIGGVIVPGPSDYLPQTGGTINGTLTVTGGITGKVNGNADTATKATSVVDYGDTNKIIKIGYTGSGLTTSNLTHIAGYTNSGSQIKDVSKSVLQDWLDLNSMINKLSTGSSTPNDADYYISQYVGGGTTTTTYHRRPMSALWAYIKSKAESVFAPKTHTHTKSQISDFPASLKNPNSLTIQNNGTTAATYDGSAAKTVNVTKVSIGLGNVDNTKDADKAVKTATKLLNNGTYNAMTFHYSGQEGQPTWVWGSNTSSGETSYVWNPANSSVNYASNAEKWNGHSLRLNHNTTDNKIPVFSGDGSMDYVLKSEITQALENRIADCEQKIAAIGRTTEVLVRTAVSNTVTYKSLYSSAVTIATCESEIAFIKISGTKILRGSNVSMQISYISDSVGGYSSCLYGIFTFNTNGSITVRRDSTNSYQDNYTGSYNWNISYYKYAA